MDASVHDWLEGRGQTVVLITMLGDATSRLVARFPPAAAVETHMDLVARWVRPHGRPMAVDTDRHGTFGAHEQGQPLADPDAETRFGRALRELDVRRMRPPSRQAKGRVEGSFWTAQDRWAKELRLAKARACEPANAGLDRVVPDHNRRFARPPRVTTDGHRRLGPPHRREAILSIPCERVVSNEYVVRWANRPFQLLPPARPGLRGGRVVIARRRDGAGLVRFGGRYLGYREGGAGGEEKTPGEGREGATGKRPPPRAKGGGRFTEAGGESPVAKEADRVKSSSPKSGHF